MFATMMFKTFVTQHDRVISTYFSELLRNRVSNNSWKALSVFTRAMRNQFAKTRIHSDDGQLVNKNKVGNSCHQIAGKWPGTRTHGSVTGHLADRVASFDMAI